MTSRKWSQSYAVKTMRLHAPEQLPSDGSLLRQWKRWEAGEVMPGEFYQPIIAALFGTITHAMFPVAPNRETDSEMVALTGMDTLELVSRLQRSCESCRARHRACLWDAFRLAVNSQQPPPRAHSSPGSIQALTAVRVGRPVARPHRAASALWAVPRTPRHSPLLLPAKRRTC
jgi:hypothetical protein